MMRPVLRQARPGRYYLTAATGTYWLVNSHRKSRKPWRLYLRVPGDGTRLIGAYPSKDAGEEALAIRLGAPDRLMSEQPPTLPE